MKQIQVEQVSTVMALTATSPDRERPLRGPFSGQTSARSSVARAFGEPLDEGTQWPLEGPLMMGTEESEPGAPSNQVVRRLQTSKVALRGAIAKVAEGRIMVSHYDSTQMLPGCAKRPLEGGPSRGHGASRMPRNGARTVFGGRGGSNATSLLDSKL